MLKYTQLFFSCLAVLIVGCGRAAPPVPPERLAPGQVGEFSVEAQPSRVTLSWNSPDSDASGKELKSMTGYTIYRMTLTGGKPGTEIQLASLKDNYLPQLIAARQRAFEEDLPPRGVKVDEKLRRHTFVDTDVKHSRIYQYRVVPTNQGDVKGASRGATVNFADGRATVTYADAESTSDDLNS